MGMPAGGGSSWAHTHDSYHLLDERGVVWGMLQAPVARDSLTLLLPLGPSPHRFLQVLAFEADAGRLMVVDRLRADPRPVQWTAERDVAELVGRPAIHWRDEHGRPIDGSPLVATIAVDRGEIIVRDARGVPRVHLVLGDAPDPAWPAEGERGAIGQGGAAVATFCLPTGPGCGVRIHAVSSP